MPDEPPKSRKEREPAKATDAIPQGLAAAGGHLLTVQFLVDFVLGIVSIALGTWYALSRPGIAVLVVAVCIAVYVLVHLWQHFTEHPRRGRRDRRRQGARTEG